MSNEDPTKDNHVISVSAETGRVSFVTEFVENTAIAMGLGHKEVMALTLAAEEVFAYLCMSIASDHNISINCINGFYYVRLDFLFDAENIDIGAFNITSKVSPDDEASLDEMGLLIASRTVDRFCFRQKSGDLSRLSLICNKQYPSASSCESEVPVALTDYEVVSPGHDAIEAFARRVWGLSQTQLIPDFFEFPGKVVDMIRSGEFVMGLAQGAQGEIGGGIVWNRSDSKTVECFGPYLFGSSEDYAMSVRLLDYCIAGIARTTTVGLWSRYPASLPPLYFESIGELEIKGPGGAVFAVPVSYRQIKDDHGCKVCTDTGLEPFLRDKYTELAFPREIITEGISYEARELRSVIATDLRVTNGQATLCPILAGADCSENIAEHLKLLHSEKVDNILFEMDLGEPWQTPFVPALLANNFKPMVLLPYAGKGDIVVFQLDES